MIIFHFLINCYIMLRFSLCYFSVRGSHTFAKSVINELLTLEWREGCWSEFREPRRFSLRKYGKHLWEGYILNNSKMRTEEGYKPRAVWTQRTLLTPVYNRIQPVNGRLNIRYFKPPLHAYRRSFRVYGSLYTRYNPRRVCVSLKNRLGRL